MVDEDKLNQFIGKMLSDLGGAFSVPMVRPISSGSSPDFPIPWPVDPSHPPIGGRDATRKSAEFCGAP